MKKIPLLSMVLITATIFALMLPGSVSAQVEGTISTTVIDEGVYVTVKESVTGEVLSLYRIEGDRIVPVDTVVNTSNRSNSDTSFPKRYLIRLDVENR
ncbi:MAG: hypothetical protein RRA15_07235 [bacterium]|nr:hypothetical protein [bacterium]MDT8366268.1 hypothetical protein [bacterium]